MWLQFEAAIVEFGMDLPPGNEGRIDDLDDLATDHLEMVMFVDHDGDGNFQYDHQGLKTIIKDIWL